MDAFGLDLLIEREALEGTTGVGLPLLFVSASPWFAVLLALAAAGRALLRWMRPAEAKCVGLDCAPNWFALASDPLGSKKSKTM